MKKIIWGVAVVVFLVAGITGFFLVQQSSGPVMIESVLPAKPVFYVRIVNLSERIEKFAATKLFNDLKSLDYKKFASAIGVPEQGIADAQRQLADSFSLENQKFLKALFGREVAVAVYTDDTLKDLQAKTPEEAKKLAIQLAGNIFIATRVNADFAVTESLLKFWGQFSKDFKIDTKRYNGKDIHLIASQDGSLLVAYVRFKDIVIVGVGEKAARTAVNVIAKKQKALSADEDFIERVESSTAGTDTVGFLDVRIISAMIAAQISEMAKVSQAQAYFTQLNEQLKQTQGVETLVFTNSAGEVLTGKAQLYFDKAKLDPGMRGFYTCSPDDNRSAKFIPGQAIFYEWSSCLDFPLMWSQYKEQLVLQGKVSGHLVDIEQMIGSYEKMLGLSISEDILPVLGKEFGIYLTDVDTTGNFPVPRIVAFLQVTAPDKMTAIINKLLALQPDLRPQEETYQGQVIRYISVPFVDSLKLSYTFIDNYFLLASNVDILKASLDAAQDPSRSIAANNILRAVEGKKNSLFFIQLDRLLEKVCAVLDWSVQMAAQEKNQRQAFLAGSQKNIDDIKGRNDALRLEAQGKEARLAQFVPTADPAADLVAKNALQTEIENVRKEITANEQQAKDIAAQVDAYKTKAPKDNGDLSLLAEFGKPLLNALMNIKYFLTTTVNGEGVLGSTMQLKIE